MLEFDFISKLLMGLLSPALARGGKALERQVFKSKGITSDGGTPEQRFVAYERLRRTCVELRTFLDVLWSLPVRFVGGLVSLPIHFRLLHRIPTLGAEVNDAFLGVAVVGRGEAAKAAQVLGDSLQAVLKQHEQAHAKRSRRAMVPTDWSSFDDAIGNFAAASRSDLGIRPLDNG